MKVNILGVQVSNLRKREVLDKVRGYIADHDKHYIVTPNPEFVMDAQKDKEFKEILNKADIAIADGTGLIFASWYILKPIKQRIHGVDLVWGLIKLAAKNNWSIYLLGGEQGIAEKTVKVLKKKEPSLSVFSYNKDFVYGVDNDNEVVGEINKIKPALLLVAFGHRKQEKWIARNLAKLDIKVAIGVGGTFDYISGTIKRAPKMIRLLGFEWLVRLFRQPSRLPRIIKAVIRFVWVVVFKGWEYK